MEIPDYIYTLIAKSLDGEASADDRLALEAWLSESTGNRATYQQLEEIHHSASQYLQQPVNTARAWRNIEARIASSEKQDFGRPAIYRSMTRTFAVAASLFIVFLGLWYARSIFFASWEKVVASNTNLEQRLPDGSLIWLRKGGILEWRKDFADHRQIKLSGEAYFDVKQDRDNAFTVTTPQSITTVVGTAFIIRSQGGLDQVIVTRGKVNVASIAANKPTATLLPGDKLVLSKDKLTRSSVSDANFLAWKTGLLSFKEMNLEKVLKVISDFYQVPVMAKTKNLAESVSVTVSFDHEPLEKVLEEISLITGLAVAKQADGSYLYYKK